MGTIQIVLFEDEGYRPPTIAKILKSEGIFVSRRGVAKFYQEYTYLFALVGPRVAKHVKKTTHATYARAYTRPYQKTETGKLKRNGNTTFKFRSSSVQFPFNTHSPPVFLCVFFKRAPVVWIEQGNFFLMPTVCIIYIR